MTIPSVMEVAANALRGLIVAAPGKKLVASDLSNIEGRVLAWLAGEEWKLEVFRKYDTFVLDEHGRKIPDPKKKGEFLREGPDVYVTAIARMFRLLVEAVTSYQRQQGKGVELSMGYEGGVGAFLNIAATYGLDLDELTEAAYPIIPQRILEEATGLWDWAVRKNRTFGLPQRTYVVCDSLKRLWREAHPATCALWKAFQDNAAAVICQPNLVRQVGCCELSRVRNWFRIRLPSGRYLCYPSPRVSDEGKISYMGVNQYTRQWSRIGTYSGKFAENVTQAVARDVIADVMPRAEAAGYPIVLTVHDELLCEPDDRPEFNADGLSAILAKNPSWADGLPLAAAGFEGYRYGKH